MEDEIFDKFKYEITIEEKTGKSDLVSYVKILKETPSHALRDRLAILLVDNFNDRLLYEALLELAIRKELKDHNATLIYALGELEFNSEYLDSLIKIFQKGDYHAALEIANILATADIDRKLLRDRIAYLRSVTVDEDKKQILLQLNKGLGLKG